MLTLIVMAPAVAQGAVLFFGGWISRTGPRRLLRRAATLGRLPMALVGLLLVPSIAQWSKTEEGLKLVPWFFLVLVTISGSCHGADHFRVERSAERQLYR